LELKEVLTLRIKEFKLESNISLSKEYKSFKFKDDTP
jgi:hypothetical protein